MTAGLLESAKEQIHTATEAYIRMSQIQMLIKSLQDVSITGDDMDNLKGDLDDIKAMLRDCTRQVAGKAPAVPAPLPPSLPPAANPDSRHQRTMMEVNATDE